LKGLLNVAYFGRFETNGIGADDKNVPCKLWRTKHRWDIPENQKDKNKNMLVAKFDKASHCVCAVPNYTC
jgi:hypothetical protein